MKVVISRSEAKAKNLVRYFTALPCAHGHISERLVSNSTCTECAKIIARKSGRKYRKTDRAKELAKARCDEYRLTEKYKQKSSETTKRYNARPDVKKRKAEFWKNYNRIPVTLEKQREYHSRPEVRNRLNERARERRATDIQFKIKANLRTRLHAALNGREKRNSAVRLLGCSLDDLRTYLEHQFQPGMSWDNWSNRGWHIDHIRPLSSFDLTDPGQLARACHYTNLQPLWWRDNMVKGAKVAA